MHIHVIILIRVVVENWMYVSATVVEMFDKIKVQDIYLYLYVVIYIYR